VIGWFRRSKPGLPLLGENERAAGGLVVLFGMAVPIVVLVALFVIGNVYVARSTEAPRVSSTAMTIEVVGRRWFWEVRYPGTAAVTANEIHIPVATRVNLVARTAYVIHSFWVPALNRKIDMIPGQSNRILLEADRAGRYRGQCAEFCGPQHANMSMYVIAEPAAAFRAWLAAQARPAAAPAGTQAQRGAQVFANDQCASCHAIRGTSAAGTIGPDLTHVASRETLAALTIPNTPAELRAWIRDPQHIKPGNLMPALGLGDADLAAVVAYLQGLR
jgi:cytochrome c oxidase subunit 2